MQSLSPRRHLSRSAFEILVAPRREIVAATARTDISGLANAFPKPCLQASPLPCLLVSGRQQHSATHQTPSNIHYRPPPIPPETPNTLKSRQVVLPLSTASLRAAVSNLSLTPQTSLRRLNSLLLATNIWLKNINQLLVSIGKLLACLAVGFPPLRG